MTHPPTPAVKGLMKEALAVPSSACVRFAAGASSANARAIRLGGRLRTSLLGTCWFTSGWGYEVTIAVGVSTESRHVCVVSTMGFWRCFGWGSGWLVPLHTMLETVMCKDLFLYTVGYNTD